MNTKTTQRKTCTHAACNKPVTAKGLCSLHYYRNRKENPRGPFQSEMSCKIPACDTPAKLKGYCRKHYSAELRHGDATKEIYNTNNPPNCQVITCRNRQVAHGLCRKHYDSYRHVKKTADIVTASEYIQFKNVSQKK